MKQLTFFAAVILLLATSCKKDDPEPSGGGGGFTPNTSATGRIEGVNWTFADGLTKRYSVDDPWFFTLYKSDMVDPCDAFSVPHEDRVIFGMDSLQIGTFPLGFMSQTVTLYDEETSNNIVCTEGTLKITSIDTATHVVKGSLDVTYDANNAVKGTFTVTICE